MSEEYRQTGTLMRILIGVGSVVENIILAVANVVAKYHQKRAEKKELEKTIDILEERLSKIKSIYVKEAPEVSIPTEDTAMKERLRIVLELRKKELEKPFLYRLAENFARLYQEPVEKFAKSISGLELDLYRADIPLKTEVYVAVMIIAGVLMAIMGTFGFLAYGSDLVSSIMGGIIVGIFTIIYLRYYPVTKWKKKVIEVEKELQYALRHIAALLSAGIGVAEAFHSVAIAGYGAISNEARIILSAMASGVSFEDALREFERRVPSEKVARTVNQIIRAQKFGGNLSKVLYDLAEEFSHEYRMRLVEYVQKIMGLSFVYMFISVITPLFFVIAISAASVLGGTFAMPITAFRVILVLIFPAVAGMIVYFIKQREPR